MAWDLTKARERIERMKADTPSTSVLVEGLATFMTERRVSVAKAINAGSPAEPVWYVPRNRAVTTHGVHIYANLMDYNSALTASGKDSEQDHERALQFLNLHYRACDQLIAAFELQRVDFHGARLHAVVLTPEGIENERARIDKAIAFGAAFREMVERLATDYGANFRTRVRIGIDSGPAVAINSGKKSEPDPLFIGSPANHAAKLAVGEDDGVFLSPKAQAVRSSIPYVPSFGVPFVALGGSDEARVLTESVEIGGATSRGRDKLEEAYLALASANTELRKSAGEGWATFRFHHREPPLKSIDFADHPPSNAIGMTLVSLFCDLDAFTAYIDNAIASGTVAEAVSNLHVIRGEMAAVLRDDFGGRKVRFVGDCLHGLIAEGSATSTSATRSVEVAVYAAAGIRSSFDLCKKLLPNIESLGLAIGLEFGWTPACRIGLRGDSSVRCASSRTTCLSEEIQQGCSGVQTALGEGAYQEANAAVRRLFANGRVVDNLNYPNAVAHLAGVASPAVVRSPIDGSAPAVAAATKAPEPFRAHGR